MQTFHNAGAGDIVLDMADEIIKNRAYLSEIDGKIERLERAIGSRPHDD